MEKYFDYLEKLRNSGVCNMWEATRYLEKEFGLSHKEAGDILVAWIKSKEAQNND